MVTASPQSWQGLMRQRSDLACEPLVSGWGDMGRPLIVRRAIADDPPGQIPLGLPLPPAQGKRRLSLTLRDRDILRAEPPPLLADAAASAPRDWHATIDRLLALDPSTRTFGSLAWQHMTGLPYLTATSDLDLLWYVGGDVDMPARLRAVAAIAARAPLRIDGEIVGAAGGVHWREAMIEGNGQILVKASRAVETMTYAEFLARGPQ
jgi:malonate decarboxylase holo-[acyl-carrier-protein] synthase